MGAYAQDTPWCHCHAPPWRDRLHPQQCSIIDTLFRDLPVTYDNDTIHNVGIWCVSTDCTPLFFLDVYPFFARDMVALLHITVFAAKSVKLASHVIQPVICRIGNILLIYAWKRLFNLATCLSCMLATCLSCMLATFLHSMLWFCPYFNLSILPSRKNYWFFLYQSAETTCPLNVTGKQHLYLHLLPTC